MTTASPSTDQPTDRPPVRPQLRRSGSEKMLGGVCGGLAEHTGIDPLLWRAGFIALAVTGAGVLVYLLLWVLMPPAEHDEKPNALDRVVGDLHNRLTGGRAAAPRG